MPRKVWQVAIEAPSGFVVPQIDSMALPVAVEAASWALLALGCVWRDAAERIFLAVPLATGGFELFPFSAFSTEA